ncbi:TIR domain-containing protein [Sphingomonas sanguinis]|nr:TIR domain-containing protein [Sphingomonas sanguinis]
MRRSFYNVFISHAWHRSASYDGVVRLLNEQPRFRWRGYSFGGDRLLAGPDERLPTRTLKALIAGRLGRSNCPVLTASVYIDRRRCVQEEIDLAVEMHKPIVAVLALGQKRLPRRLHVYADHVAR